jgi:dihydroorotate dehydrogenase (fumarate)
MDFSTTYMGLKLSSPLVASSSPLSMDLGSLRKLEDFGAGAVVLASLFEEQIEHDADELEHYLHYGADRFAESLSYFPEPCEFHSGAQEYLEYIAKASQAIDIPIIASLNGVSARGWITYAAKAQQAGAAALELNVYYIPTNPELTSKDVECVYAAVLAGVKAGVTIPVSMKLSPFFSNTAAMATCLDRSGADGLVLFNRFYQPDIDPEALEVKLNIDLSTSADNRLPLRWIAILHGRIKASLAATSGVHTGADAAKMILAGADVAMMCSALLKHGPRHLHTVREELLRIMEANGYQSVAQMKGTMSQRNCPEPSAYERGNYIKALTGYGLTATFE